MAGNRFSQLRSDCEVDRVFVKLLDDGARPTPHELLDDAMKASIWRCLANREPPWQRMPLTGQALHGCPVGPGADGDGLSVGGLSPTHQQPTRYNAPPNLGDRVEPRPQVITHDLELPYDPAPSDRLIPGNGCYRGGKR
jgi:hypothetical protein